MVHSPERVTASVACEGEVRHMPEGGGGNFGQDCEGSTVSVAHVGDTTKSGYLKFYQGGMSIIKFRPRGGQVSESRRAPRGETSSEPSKKPTGSSDIPIPY